MEKLIFVLVLLNVILKSLKILKEKKIIYKAM